MFRFARVLSVVGVVLLGMACFVAAEEIQPLSREAKGGTAFGKFSEQSLAVALAVDRGGAVLLGHSAKERPFLRAVAPPAPRAAQVGEPIQIELVLLGPEGRQFTHRVELPGLCLDHDADTPPHVNGDSIRLHHESLVTELPFLFGFDRLEVAIYRPGAKGLERVLLGRLGITAEQDLLAAAPLGTVHWPEEYGEAERYRVWGSEAETATRINVVLVPDGYTHVQKSLMEKHAQDLVNHFRQKTPFKEHDPFFNYILVYAYSNQSGTDQCDCSKKLDTAMNTRFPNDGYPCGDSGNRCLFYGYGCDPNNWTDANITASELRAPAKDITLVMVNTTRYGGCGGARAVYAAGNDSALEIGVHELGHSLGGLADEYESYSSCGTSAGEINTSLNGEVGAWPEWIPELGKPFEGAQYYSKCVYRPVNTCEMRALGYPFCAVCNQHWSLVTYGHWRVNPTAPISAQNPASPIETTVGLPVSFAVQTRLSAAPAVNSIVWTRQGPLDPEPVVVGTGVTSFSGGFVPEGDHTLACEVTADTNYVKPVKNGANQDRVSWTIHARPIPEVSSPAGIPFTITRAAAGRLDLHFQDIGALHYNVYVSAQPGTHPFAVSDPALGKRDCHVEGVVAESPGRLLLSNYDPATGLSGPQPILFLLLTADNGTGSENSLGRDSQAVERSATARCAR